MLDDNDGDEVEEGDENDAADNEDDVADHEELKDDKNDCHWNMGSGRTSSRAVDGGGDWCSTGSGVKLEHIIIIRS